MNQEKIQHIYLHVDLDAFFASVEQMDHPEYKGKPVIVGGRPEDRRGVVSTASYEARKYGVHSAMPVYQAYKLCPQGIFVHGNMRRYAELSYKVMSIFKEFSPDVQQMSIDEALIDLTGTEKLFGPAEQTAHKIKERVRKETGLTVSVGLASTQYIAKIASGYSKPDGFYYVKPGQETDFMLSLPLDKLWGAGKKTQELMHLKGIHTTRDIYEKHLDLLQFMFGKNLGAFLYNSVRGNEELSFSRNSKSHSISAETTFPYDITDIYTAETTLMDLCYGVYFRLLREEQFSRTITLKLRYDDFSTTNAQITFERSITTLDDFFEKIKMLFEQKYEKGRGIRLLGVGFDNVEKNDRPYQQDLFESGESKNNKIEKAILELNKKHPEIKVQKARMLKHNLILFISLFSTLFALNLFKPAKIFADENTTESNGAATLLTNSDEAIKNDKIPKALFDWDVSDSNNLEFLVSGYWTAEFENDINFSFSNNSVSGFSIGVPVFTQKVDLSFWAVLNNQWTFNADFADEFTKNTLSLGYNGSGYLNSAFISNRNITMPDIYSATFFGYGISGGDSQSPGFSMHFEDSLNSLWSGDFLIRYDMTEGKNATFYGFNNVSDTYISIEDFEYGRTFVFPQDTWNYLSDIESVYVESKSGTYTDKNGKKYEKLTSDQYIVLSSNGKLLLSSSAAADVNKTSVTGSTIIPTVLVTFNNQLSVSEIINSCGSYNDKESYLGKIQNLFDSVSLEKYSYSLSSRIDDVAALVIQSSTGFSPFLVCQTYDCGIISDADIFVISKSSEKQNTDFTTELTDDENSSSVTDFFSENHKYVKVFSTSSTSADLQLPENRYPFAEKNPEIYLNLEPETDMTLLVRTYSKVSSFNIGNSAIEGTVQAYKNGVLDLGAKYDSTTGTVTLSSQIENTDKIYISWQEDSSDYSGGAITAGAGLNYLFNKNTNANFAFTARLPLVPYKNYSTADNIQKSFAALTSGINYSREHFDVSDKLSFALENQNGTGALLAYTQTSELSKTYYLSSGSGFKTLCTPSLNLATTDFLDSENNFTLTLRAAQTDAENVTGYIIPLDFDFSSADNSKENWASIDVQLSAGSTLKNSDQIEIALKNDCDMTGYDFYIQLGVYASSSFYGEESTLIPTWKINGDSTDGFFDFSSTNWQTVTLQLDDLARSRLTSYHDARLIIVKKSDSTTINNSGTVYFGPYEPYTKVLFTNADSILFVNTQTVLSESPSSNSLNISENYSTLLNWNYLSDELLSSQNTKIESAVYFDSADFSSYRTINLDFSYKYDSFNELSEEKDFCSLELILDTNAQNVASTGDIALKITLKNISSLISKEIDFHTLSVDIISDQVFIDDKELSSSDFELEIDKNVIPDRLKITFDTKNQSLLYTKGTFYLDNLYYKETNPSFVAQNNLAVAYNYSDDIIKIKNYSLLRNFSLEANSTQNVQTFLTSDSTASAAISAYGKTGFTFADINYSADLNANFSDASSQAIQNAGHSIKTEKPLFKILTLKESYRFSSSEEFLKKTDNLTFDFTDLKIPAKMIFDASSSEISSYQNQNDKLTFDFSPKIKNAKLNWNTNLEISQKINQLKTNSYSNTENYFYGYSDISSLEFSLGNKNAQNRNVDFSSRFSNSLPFNNLAPFVEYDLSSEYVNSSDVTLDDTHVIKASIPLSVSKYSFAFTYTRTGIGEEEATASGDYISDSKQLLSDLNRRSYFYTSIPFYELFEKDVSKKLQSDLLENENNTLSSKYEFVWKRKLLNSYKDLIIPSAANFAVSRDIKYSETASDIYQIKAVLTDNAINCFGSKSQLKLFKWYSQDEFQSSLTGIIKIPYEQLSASTFQTTFYNQILFYISDKNTLQTALDFSIETDFDWSVRTTFIWQRKGKNTFIIPVLMLIKPLQKANPDWKITRKDTLNVQIGREELINNQLYELIHNVDINFFENYTITTGIGFDFNYIQNSSDTLSLNVTIGGKMIW